jgi:hypothetical protein
MHIYVVVGIMVAFSFAVIGLLASIGPRPLRLRILAIRARHRIPLIVILMLFLFLWIVYGMYLAFASR